MGGGTFDPNAYRNYQTSTQHFTQQQRFTSYGLHDSLNPKGVKVRESRDSADNPNSTPVIVALDVTGSMGYLAEAIAKTGLGTLFTAIFDRKPISDPHVMFMAIGDEITDRAPLQVSQFEADNRVLEQLTQIYIEGNGGGNGSEGYTLAWYFAAFHTVHDSMEKRGKRGYLFTVGDEGVPAQLTCEQLSRIVGDDVESTLTNEELLAQVQRQYNVYHVIVKEGHFASSHMNTLPQMWRTLLGENVLILEDHKALAEVIVSAIEVAEGVDAAHSAKAWGGNTAHIVHKAVGHLKHNPANRPQLGHM